jgi:S1-C subfamily serine protease
MDTHADTHAFRSIRLALTPVLTLVLAPVLALVLGLIGIAGTGQAAPLGPPLTQGASAQAAFVQPPLTQLPVPRVAATSRAPLDAEDTAELLNEVRPTLVDIDSYTGNGGSESGTGIVLSTRGLVLTNAHVIADAADIRATDLGEGYTYQARVLGANLEHDIALIQLTDAAHLRTAILGDSNTVHIGDQVASIGQAFGLGDMSIGTGPVTHLHRGIASTTDPDPDAAPLTGLIEARSWIRPGQSGGPMVLRDGEVIGINVAYTTAADGTILSTGYAIPINQAIDVAHELLADNTR